jgi:hypothetical protein
MHDIDFEVPALWRQLVSPENAVAKKLPKVQLALLEPTAPRPKGAA